MTLDILMKLINLANKNPNEHEANSAARKVCKELGSGNFVIREVTPTPNATNPDFYRPTERQKEYNSPTGRTKEKEPKAQGFRQESNPRSSAGYRTGYNFGGFSSVYEDWVRKHGFNPRSEPGKRYERSEPVYNREGREEKERTCTKCGCKVKTFRTIEPFICGICALRDM